MRRSYFKRRSKKRKNKSSDVELWKSFGLSKPYKPRYKGYKGLLWYVISRYVRKSEWLQYGECCDGCGTKIPDWKKADCGHFVSASRGFCTLFTRKNLGLQSKRCNNPSWTPDSAYGFGRTIDKRYGDGTADLLVAASKGICQDYSEEEYKREIKRYIDLFNKLGEKKDDEENSK